MTSASRLFDDLRHKTEFTVTAAHLKLLRRAYVGWDDCEFGAPALDCKRPYGNSAVLRDIAEITEPDLAAAVYDGGDDHWETYEDEREEEFTRLHAETGVVLQIALHTGEFRIGRYVRERFGDWHLAEDGHSDGLRNAVDEQTRQLWRTSQNDRMIINLAGEIQDAADKLRAAAVLPEIG